MNRFIGSCSRKAAAMVEQGQPWSWSAVELEDVQRCPVCDVDDSKAIYGALQDYLVGVPGTWPMRICLNCESLYLSRRPTVASIAKAYSNYYTHGDGKAAHVDDNGQSLLWRWSNGYMNTRFGATRVPATSGGRWILPMIPPLRQQLDFFYRHLPKTPGRLLDVGCGNGVFLLRARDAGWAVEGLEPDPVASAAARRSGLDVVAGTLDEFAPEGQFDAITASHVIEHVHHPRRFLEQIFALLRPGGQVWLATPNAHSFGRRWYGPYWRGLEPPRHMTVLSPKALVMLLQDAGFNDIELLRRGRGASYILRSSAETARREGVHKMTLPPLLVDALASLRAGWSEECVVRAHKRS
jgi:2-polyprenyl-3-methyl-5-hydroxy-6-metoxy-1,4-benzoquinol methylase